MTKKAKHTLEELNWELADNQGLGTGRQPGSIIEPSSANVLEAAAKFNVCRQLEACVWHQLYPRTWHDLPAIR